MSRRVRASRPLVAAPILAALLVAAGCGPDAGNGPESAAVVPATRSALCPDCNLVVVSLDTLRADRLALYGSTRPTATVLSRFAEQAVVFDRFFSNGGGTLPSHTSLFTSLHPLVHDVTTFNRRRLEEERTTLAESLRDRGFTTAAFTDSGWMSRVFDIDQGFETWDERGGRFEAILPRALRWLDDHAGRPFFLFVHSYDVHSEWDRLPYDCPGDWASRYLDEIAPEIVASFDGCRDELCASRLLVSINEEIRAGRSTLQDHFSVDQLELLQALYDGCLDYADHRLGELFDRLDQKKLLDETIVVVLSDHGEEFGDHGMVLHEQDGYEHMIHVPLLIRLPGGLHGGERRSGLAAMVDLYPTLLELLGIPSSPTAQGRSLVPLLVGDRSVRDEVHAYDSLRTARFKLTLKRRELYDLEVDPAERVNLWSQEPEIVDRLTPRLRELVGEDRRRRRVFESASAPDSEGAVLSPEQQEELRALGYLPE